MRSQTTVEDKRKKKQTKLLLRKIKGFCLNYTAYFIEVPKDNGSPLTLIFFLSKMNKLFILPKYF